MTTFLYRRGNGNGGNYIRAMVTLTDSECPYAALAALVANDYIPGKRVRSHIMRTIETDGEAEYGIHATVYEGPDSETEFDAAYITAELQPLDDRDLAHYKAQSLTEYDTLRGALDRGAWAWFRKGAK
jgi:hypothetical protein